MVTLGPQRCGVEIINVFLFSKRSFLIESQFTTRATPDVLRDSAYLATQRTHNLGSFKRKKYKRFDYMSVLHNEDIFAERWHRKRCKTSRRAYLVSLWKYTCHGQAMGFFLTLDMYFFLELVETLAIYNSSKSIHKDWTFFFSCTFKQSIITGFVLETKVMSRNCVFWFLYISFSNVLFWRRE